ncbi:MAG: hypothetical protein H6Q89_4178, partial [Myxococcaceae bacterium]|nr:hypothetical protein [Myxococcaceae bacterium]
MMTPLEMTFRSSLFLVVVAALGGAGCQCNPATRCDRQTNPCQYG